MGHRASVAYKHDDIITVHYSHWGGFGAKLLDQISDETPLGSENMEPEYVNELVSVLGEMTDNSELSVAGKLAERQDTAPVEAKPYAVCDSFEEWATEHVNYLHHECAYFVDTTVDPWDVKAFAPMYWKDSLEMYGGDGQRGCLVEAGEESHDLWGGIEAKDFNVFIQKACLRADCELQDLIY